MNPRQRKISTTVYLTPEQVAALGELSDKLSIPQAVMIRYGVDVGISYYRSVVETLQAEREKGALE